MADETNPLEAVEEPQDGAATVEATEPEPAAVDPAELDRLRVALKNANKEAEKHRLRLKEADDAKLSEIEKARRDAEEATRELAELRRNSIRQKVALDTGLPAKWVARLQGDTEEELAADAATILADLNTTRKPAPDLSQGPRETALSDEERLYDSIYGSRKA